MEKFFIIYHKSCPNFSRFKLILDVYALEYSLQEVVDGNGLKLIINSLFQNYQGDFIINSFYGSVILYKNQVIYDTTSLLNQVFSVKKIHISHRLIEVLEKESWLNIHFMGEFYWLSVGNLMVDLFRKPFLTSERNQVGNNILIQKLHLLNNFFQYKPWLLGDKISLSDFSLLIIFKGIVQKNPNLMMGYTNLHNWFLRMNSKEDWLFFLKNQ